MAQSACAMASRFLKQLPLGLLCRMLPRHHPVIWHRLHDLVFEQTDLRVAQGPFAGLKLSHQSVGSELLPKMVGSYERELHEVIEEFIAGDYGTLINIGCAEGYYAVGFAMRWKRLPRRVLAFDVNPAALKLTSQVAEWNGVAHKVECLGECGHESFGVAAQSRTLVICDIEGAERDLLDPECAPGLRHCDLLVEIHDGRGEPIIRRTLEKRFASSHEQSSIQATARTRKELGPLAQKIPTALAALAMDERRSNGFEWMVMKTNDALRNTSRHLATEDCIALTSAAATAFPQKRTKPTKLHVNGENLFTARSGSLSSQTAMDERKGLAVAFSP